MSVPAEKMSPASALSSVTVSAARSQQELEAFLHVPWELGNQSDPNWVPPLLDDYRRMLDPKKSPFLEHGEVECFIARDGGRAVGRISVQIDRGFDTHWKNDPE